MTDIIMSEYEVIAGMFVGEIVTSEYLPYFHGDVWWLKVSRKNNLTCGDLPVDCLRDTRDTKLKCTCPEFVVGAVTAFPNDTAVVFCNICKKCIRFHDKYRCLKVLTREMYTYKGRYNFVNNPLGFNQYCSVMGGPFDLLKMTSNDFERVSKILLEV